MLTLVCSRGTWCAGLLNIWCRVCDGAGKLDRIPVTHRLYICYCPHIFWSRCSTLWWSRDYGVVRPTWWQSLATIGAQWWIQWIYDGTALESISRRQSDIVSLRGFYVVKTTGVNMVVLGCAAKVRQMRRSQSQGESSSTCRWFPFIWLRSFQVLRRIWSTPSVTKCVILCCTAGVLLADL